LILKKLTIFHSSNVKIANRELLFLTLFTLFVIAALSLQSPLYAAPDEFADSKINWYDKALSFNQNNVPALVEKGTELVATGNPEQAITWLDRALNLDSENMMGLVSKGAALRQLGEYQEAIATYDKVLAIDPHDAYAIGGKADSLYMSGQLEQALTWINKALELNPTDARIQLVHESLSETIN
jgi:tetratricopeptide (TPR) repeat protein